MKREGQSLAGRLTGTLTIPRFAHKVGINGLLVSAKLIDGHQRVLAIVEVRGVVELKAAMVLALGEVVDHGLDVVVLSKHFPVEQPPQCRRGIPSHAERDAPVVIRNCIQEFGDLRSN